LRGIGFAYQLANSQDPAVIEWVRGLGPFDWIFIDANHTYEGVMSDFFAIVDGCRWWCNRLA